MREEEKIIILDEHGLKLIKDIFEHEIENHSKRMILLEQSIQDLIDIKFDEDLEYYNLKIRQCQRLDVIFNEILLSRNESEEYTNAIRERKDCLPAILKSLESYRNKAEKKEFQPTGDRLDKMQKILLEINKHFFVNSSLDQWIKIINKGKIDEPIRIQKKCLKKDFVYLFDQLKSVIGFKISDIDVERSKAFRFNGVNLSSKQIRDGRSDYKNNYYNTDVIDKILLF